MSEAYFPQVPSSIPVTPHPPDIMCSLGEPSCRVSHCRCLRLGVVRVYSWTVGELQHPLLVHSYLTTDTISLKGTHVIICSHLHASVSFMWANCDIVILKNETVPFLLCCLYKPADDVFKLFPADKWSSLWRARHDGPEDVTGSNIS